MPFQIQCRCGEIIEVTSGQADTDVACACGEINRVPLLSNLRRRIGRGSYESNVADRVSKLVAAGELPTDECIQCGVKGGKIVQCDVACELPYLERESSTVWYWLLNLITVPFWQSFIFCFGSSDTKLVGRERVVQAPFRLCDRCVQTDAGGKLQDRTALKKILCNVEVYRELLEDNPDAEIFV